MSLGYNASSFVKAFDKSYLEALASPNLTVEEKGELIANARSCHPQITDGEDKIVYTFDVAHFEMLEIVIRFFGDNKFAVEGHHTIANGVHRDVQHVFQLPPHVDRTGWSQRNCNGTLTLEFPKIHPMDTSCAPPERKRTNPSPLI